MGMTSPEELLMVSSLLWSSIYMKYGIFYPKKIALASNLYYMDWISFLSDEECCLLMFSFMFS